jgi:hypothetical protein
MTNSEKLGYKKTPRRVYGPGFEPKTRPTQAAVEMRLGHALAIVKAQQDITRPTKVMTNSQKGGYKKRGRKVYGPDYYEELLPAQAAVEMPV